LDPKQVVKEGKMEDFAAAFYHPGQTKPNSVFYSEKANFKINFQSMQQWTMKQWIAIN